ncbi:MAG: sensor domain-containing protein, partial [Deltaproteobacteria bacterium CG17_big_fil_post_rev_8_21_14_2_50_63_7]
MLVMLATLALLFAACEAKKAPEKAPAKGEKAATAAEEVAATPDVAAAPAEDV